MKFRNLAILFLIILFTVLQCTVLNYLQIFKTKPDLLLILIIFCSLYYGQLYGLFVGAVCGLFSEATSGISLGFAVFAYSLGGFILGYSARWVYPIPAYKSTRYSETFLSQICISFIFSVAVYSILFFLLQINNRDLSLFKTLIFIILPASLYTAAVAPALLYFLKTTFNIENSFLCAYDFSRD